MFGDIMHQTWSSTGHYRYIIATLTATTWPQSKIIHAPGKLTNACMLV